MTIRTEQRLLILTPRLGVMSETFIERHCRDLAPGTVSFATFAVDRDSSGWPAAVTTLLPELPKPRPTIRARALDHLRQDQSRHARRAVWWVSDGAVASILQHVERHHVRCALLEYLDRWLNVIPHLVDAGLRVVVHGHGYDLSSALRNPATVAAYRTHLTCAASVVVPSHHAAGRLAEIGVTNVEVIPYGIPLGDRAAGRPPTNRSVRLIAVGRFVAKKDPVGLVRAVARARSLGADLHLDLIGDGPLRPAVEHIVKQQALGETVQMHGALPNDQVVQALQAADVFVQRSVVAKGGDEEGLPLAILEAMAAGLPVVSTKHAGIPEAVLDGETGFLRNETDLEGFAACIALYCDDPALRAEHGLAGRRRAEALFSWERNRADLRAALGLSAQSPSGAR